MLLRAFWRWFLKKKDPPAAARAERAEEKIRELRHDVRNIQTKILPLARLLDEMERVWRGQKEEGRGGTDQRS